jgi:hypothetical protein
MNAGLDSRPGAPAGPLVRPDRGPHHALWADLSSDWWPGFTTPRHLTMLLKEPLRSSRSIRTLCAHE